MRSVAISDQFSTKEQTKKSLEKRKRDLLGGYYRSYEFDFDTLSIKKFITSFEDVEKLNKQQGDGT